jgi:hypothetical protein
MSSSGILHSSVLMLCIYLVIIHTAFAQQQTHHQQHQEQTNLVIKKINDQPTQTQSIMDEFFSAANTISHPSGDHNGLSAIHGCNKVIGTIHPSESYKTLNTFVMNTRPDLAQTLNGTFFNLLKYGVQVKTVCASCSTIKTTSQDLKNVDYERYCGKNVYGYDEQQSGLVMIPLVVDENDESDKLVELHGTLAAFIHTRSTKINTYDVPSQLWTPDDEDGYQSVDIILCFLATAASGKVSFAPDLMGYGLSESLKSYLVRDSYVTSMLPLWKKVSSDLSAMTDCKTALGDAAFLQGYSEGGKLIMSITFSVKHIMFTLLKNAIIFFIVPSFHLINLSIFLCLVSCILCRLWINSDCRRTSPCAGYRNCTGQGWWGTVQFADYITGIDQIL